MKDAARNFFKEGHVKNSRRGGQFRMTLICIRKRSQSCGLAIPIAYHSQLLNKIQHLSCKQRNPIHKLQESCRKSHHTLDTIKVSRKKNIHDLLMHYRLGYQNPCQSSSSIIIVHFLDLSRNHLNPRSLAKLVYNFASCFSRYPLDFNHCLTSSESLSSQEALAATLSMD